jgi:plastocyanin
MKARAGTWSAKHTHFDAPSPVLPLHLNGHTYFGGTTMSVARTLTLSLVVAVVSVSCGGGGGYSGGATTPTPTPGGTGSASVVTVTIRGVNGAQSFTPNPASCAAGQTVVFHNADSVTHRVVLDDQSVDTGSIAPGASSAPQQLGAVNKSYHCSLHPSMVGSLNSATTPDPPPCTGYCG